MLLKQKVMFISREIIVKRDRRRSVDGSVDGSVSTVQALVCTSIVDYLYCNRRYAQRFAARCASYYSIHCYECHLLFCTYWNMVALFTKSLPYAVSRDA